MVPKTHLSFIRHGQQEPASSEVPHLSGLTERGRMEARAVGVKLRMRSSAIWAFSVGNVRSLATVALALHPDIADSDINDKIRELRQSRRLRVATRLQYLPIEDTEFESLLADSFSRSTALRFLVEHSDEYRLSSNSRMSSYSTLAYESAKAVLFFCQERRTVGIDEIRGAAEENLHLLFCGREFVYACFRAQLLENIDGLEARDGYVRWYGNVVEWAHEARQDVATMTIHHCPNSDVLITLADSYGEMNLEMAHLQRIVTAYEKRFGPSVQHGKR